MTDIIQRLRDNADLDEAEGGNADVVALEREAADEIERLREGGVATIQQGMEWMRRATIAEKKLFDIKVVIARE